MNQQINVKQHCWDNEKGAEMVHNDMHGTEFRLLLRKVLIKILNIPLLHWNYSIVMFSLLAQEENNSIRFEIRSGSLSMTFSLEEDIGLG